ncbi:MAG: hypothetical protein ABI948_08370 [Thermoleophilia bacterium]
MRFVVIGNAARAAEDGFYFLQDAEAERRSMARRRRESLAAVGQPHGADKSAVTPVP